MKSKVLYCVKEIDIIKPTENIYFDIELPNWFELFGISYYSNGLTYDKLKKMRECLSILLINDHTSDTIPLCLLPMGNTYFELKLNPENIKIYLKTSETLLLNINFMVLLHGGTLKKEYEYVFQNKI